MLFFFFLSFVFVLLYQIFVQKKIRARFHCNFTSNALLSILFQLKVQEALRKREKFTKEHEEVSLTSIINVLFFKQTLNTK